jgi:DNA primase
MDDIAAINEQVRISTVLRDYHVDIVGSEGAEQIHCPFHYPDTNKSCRVYHDTDSLYCFVCDKSWDVIEFVKDKEELTFGQAVAFVKRHYGVEVIVPDYEARLKAMRRQPREDKGEAGVIFERMFIDAANTLTSGQLVCILSVYNKCLADKDDLQLTESYTVADLKDWYERSVRVLRLELENG